MFPCPQSSDHRLDTVFCNPNKNRGQLTALRKATKSAKPIRLRIADTQTVIQISKRLDSFLYEMAQNFEIFSNIQKVNFKKTCSG
jgi:hypothetical protein